MVGQVLSGSSEGEHLGPVAGAEATSSLSTPPVAEAAVQTHLARCGSDASC